MTRFVEHLEIIRQRPDQLRLLAGGAAIALVAGIAGAMIASSGDKPATPTSTEAKETEETGPAGFVTLAPQQLAANGIVVERVRAGSIRSEILAQATVTASPQGEGVITAHADGAVARMNKRLGDPVGAGETVALLESRDAAAFVAQRNAAAARAQAARLAAAREQRLFDANITARQDLEAAIAVRSTAEAELQSADAAVRTAGVAGDGRYLAARSPIAGRITQVKTQLGAFVTAGTELFHIADPRSIQVEAAVPVTDARLISPGDPALIELPDGRAVDSVVRSLTPALNPESRAATVVLQLNAATGGLTQGQAVRVRIAPRNGAASGIVLPDEAVQQLNGRHVVFVQTKGGFQAVPVTLGERGGGRTEIVSGLKEGQVVVTRGAFALKSQLGASEAEE